MPFKRGQLRYFVTVADEGQMTRAARKLHVAQPALSHAIAQLEAELGIELLARHARGVSLTPAGETFLEKARVALEADTNAELTARSLARAARSKLEFGYIGLPPAQHSPQLFAAFADARPEAQVSFRELPFPSDPMASWVEDVDVALCHLPTPDPDVRAQPLRAEERVVIAPKAHPLAARPELAVADLLEETFAGYDAAVQSTWAGFWTLDDHRGGPPAATVGHAQTAAEMFAIIAARRAITTAPAFQAAHVERLLRGIVAIPLRDARPAVLSLVWPSQGANPLVGALATVAERLANPDRPAARGQPDQSDEERASAAANLNGRLGERRKPGAKRRLGTTSDRASPS
jgi:DNA-binding transcriptional LysR family regulator